MGKARAEEVVVALIDVELVAEAAITLNGVVVTGGGSVGGWRR